VSIYLVTTPLTLCGTGGDGKDTFNISTLASFVAAGAGIKVAKHGNYGVSSISGSSNVMETRESDLATIMILEKSMDKAGIAILHAPLFILRMKNVGPIRKARRKNFFQHVRPYGQSVVSRKTKVGVFNLELARCMYAYLYQDTATNYTILHSLDGYDEVSLTCPTKVITPKWKECSMQQLLVCNH
jgi:anthranilate phosphoribosyltransferase